MSPFRPSFPPQSDVYPKRPYCRPSLPTTHHPLTHFSSRVTGHDESQVTCLHQLAASLASPKKSTPLHSSKSSLFFGNTRGGGYLFTSPCWNQQLSGTWGSPRSISPLVTRHSPLPLDCGPQFRSPLTPFRINTCKSVTKQMTLSTCTINTYEKTGGGG